jgi:hypothetical protein
MLPPKKPDRLSFKWDRDELSLSAEGRVVSLGICVCVLVLTLIYLLRH